MKFKKNTTETQETTCKETNDVKPVKVVSTVDKTKKNVNIKTTNAKTLLDELNKKH